ncbi:MAG: hypothetical protein ACK55I_01110, partial [bacterium]
MRLPTRKSGSGASIRQPQPPQRGKKPQRAQQYQDREWAIRRGTYPRLAAVQKQQRKRQQRHDGGADRGIEPLHFLEA